MLVVKTIFNVSIAGGRDQLEAVDHLWPPPISSPRILVDNQSEYVDSEVATTIQNLLMLVTMFLSNIMMLAAILAMSLSNIS
jgi:hypothetical protein